jgi:hypothetical protein
MTSNESISNAGRRAEPAESSCYSSAWRPPAPSKTEGRQLLDRRNSLRTEVETNPSEDRRCPPARAEHLQASDPRIHRDLSYSGSRSNRSQGEEKGDWLAALDEQSTPRISLAGRVPVPLFRPQHECDPL